MLFGYSCHATAINDEKVNGDYCGHACHCIEQEHPGVVALFVVSARRVFRCRLASTLQHNVVLNFAGLGLCLVEMSVQ